MSNFRRINELSKRSGDSPSRRKTASAATMNTTVQKKPAVMAPEDNWMGAGNPSSYFDELPQPYRFINKCL